MSQLPRAPPGHPTRQESQDSGPHSKRRHPARGCQVHIASPGKSQASEPVPKKTIATTEVLAHNRGRVHILLVLAEAYGMERPGCGSIATCLLLFRGRWHPEAIAPVPPDSKGTRDDSKRQPYSKDRPRKALVIHPDLDSSKKAHDPRSSMQSNRAPLTHLLGWSSTLLSTRQDLWQGRRSRGSEARTVDAAKDKGS